MKPSLLVVLNDPFLRDKGKKQALEDTVVYKPMVRELLAQWPRIVF